MSGSGDNTVTNMNDETYRIVVISLRNIPISLTPDKQLL